jgi:hypothetical protein
MREMAAHSILLARSIEEADPEGILLDESDRRAATEEGRAVAGPPDLAAERRAEVLLAAVARRAPAFDRIRKRAGLPFAVFPVVAVFAFGLGLSTDSLGSSRQINLLAFPLLALLAWNLGAYALMLAHTITGRLLDRRGESPAGPVSGPEASRIPNWMASLAAWAAEWTMEKVRAPDPAGAEALARGLAVYAREWPRLTLPLFAARARVLFHVGAASLAVGVVGGMYLRGLGFAYRAMWESTFLSSSVVAQILHVVLGPAAVVLGVELPDAEGLALLEQPPGDPAAPWIHLWALTTGAIVVLPRSLLAIVHVVRAAALARRVPVDPTAGSFRVLMPADRGTGLRVELMPYARRLSPDARAGLVDLAAEVFGPAAEIAEGAPTVWGIDADPADPPEPGATALVIVFALVQTPEREVHAQHVERWMQGEVAPRILVVVDRSGWREHFGVDDGGRRNTRMQAWDRILGEVGMGCVHVDLGTPLAVDDVARAEQVVWNGVGARGGHG